MRKGISPILSVMILIGIATIGGAMLYGIQNKFLESSLTQIDLRIVDFRIEKDSEGSCYFQSNFYNAGTESIQSINIKTTLDSGEDFVDFVNIPNNELAPGDFVEKFDFKPTSNIECGNFTTSNTYSVLIDASSVDSVFSISKHVTVENVKK